MNLKLVLAGACALAALAIGTAPEVRADKLTVGSSAPSAGMPSRGMTMAQVEGRYGAPIAKLPSAGGDAPRHPQINRWQYSGYTVYFERSRVIHSVPNPAAS